MTSLRYLLPLVLALFVVSCGSSTTSDGGTCNPLAFAMLNTANSNAKVCSATVKCIDDMCADAAKKCAGPDYKAMTYAGTCGGYLNCVKGCDCAKACVDKCEVDSPDCASCLSIDFALGCTLKCVSEIASCGR